MITTCFGVVAEKLLPMLDKFEKIDLLQFCLESSENLDFWEKHCLVEFIDCGR